jgi:hypothetical protein
MGRGSDAGEDGLGTKGEDQLGAEVVGKASAASLESTHP